MHHMPHVPTISRQDAGDKFTLKHCFVWFYEVTFIKRVPY